MPEQAEEQQMHDYVRINVAEVTPRTSAPYAVISHTERHSIFVLNSDDGSGKLLVGPMGVDYYLDGPPDHDLVYLRRWDAEPQRVKIVAKKLGDRRPRRT